MSNARKSIKAIVTAAVVTVGMLLTAATCSAENAPQGTVTVAVEKLTLGQGFVVEPVNVPFYEGDNGSVIMERAAEIAYTSYEYDGVQYSYISGFADKTSDAVLKVPDLIKTALAESGSEIGTRAADGWLSEFDYTASGGYVYFVNDIYPSYGIGDYAPADGDVIRFAFTLYGYGADCGIDNSAWGGAAAVMPALNRSALTKLTADASENAEAYAAGVKALTEATSQDELDEAYNTVYGLFNDESDALVTEPVAPEAGETEEPAETTENTENTENAPVTSEKGSPDTGVESSVTVIAAAGLAGLILSRKKR